MYSTRLIRHTPKIKKHQGLCKVVEGRAGLTTFCIKAEVIHVLILLVILATSYTYLKFSMSRLTPVLEQSLDLS